MNQPTRNAESVKKVWKFYFSNISMFYSKWFVGEICIKLSIPSLGYFRDDEANRNAYDADGYFKTGDVGYFDDTGRLYISGRRKEIFKHRGHAIWPAEIENVLLKNSSIRNVCVTSIFDDELITEMPAALIVKQENRAITRDEVYAIVASEIKILRLIRSL